MKKADLVATPNPVVPSAELRAQILAAVEDLRAAGFSDEGIIAKAVRDLGVARAAVIARVIEESKPAQPPIADRLSRLQGIARALLCLVYEGGLSRESVEVQAAPKAVEQLIAFGFAAWYGDLLTITEDGKSAAEIVFSAGDAEKQVGQVFVEQADVCDLRGGASCGA